MNQKIQYFTCAIIFASILLLGCIGNNEVSLKYQSNEKHTLSVKQGNISMNFIIRVENDTELTRLWVPYPVSNEYQEITDYHIDGNYDYSGIYRESKYGNMIL